ncbi:hypothetical protein B0J17DRAFT_63989 [Rhizoctonia solani]|nr:hypothetical protein B0J17DRAFT_63989 [Rhizoctonia solani]
MTCQPELPFPFMFTSQWEYIGLYDIWPHVADEGSNQQSLVAGCSGPHVSTSRDIVDTAQPMDATRHSQSPLIDTTIGTVDYTFIQGSNAVPSGFTGPDTDTPSQRSRRRGACKGTHWPGSSCFITSTQGRNFPPPELSVIPNTGEFEEWFRAFKKARRQCRSNRKLPDIVCPLLGCDRRFTKCSELKAHLIFYFNIRAYKCDGCAVDFAPRGTLIGTRNIIVRVRRCSREFIGTISSSDVFAFISIMCSPIEILSTMG